MKNINTRRTFFKWAFTSLGLVALVKSNNVLAEQTCPAAAPTDEKVKKKLLKTTSSTAKRVAYVDNSATAKKNHAAFMKSNDKKLKGFKKYKDGSNCLGCKHYKNPKDGYGKCPMVGNKYVPGCGWCKLFAAK